MHVHVHVHVHVHAVCDVRVWVQVPTLILLQVEYQADGFLDKNKDSLPDSVVDTLRSSALRLPRTLFVRQSEQPAASQIKKSALPKRYIKYRIFVSSMPLYRIAGKFGGDLNLALWRSGLRSSILNPPTLITGHNACFPMCTATDKLEITISPRLFVPNLWLFRQI